MDAPFDGTVSDILPNSNEWIAPGQPILLIANLENLQVETTDLSEIDASQVNVGDRVVVTFDALPEYLVDGTVVFIAPKSTEGAGVNFKVIITMDEVPQEVRWGMTAFVDIETEQ
jgi:multidrug resistance efflux pump